MDEVWRAIQATRGGPDPPSSSAGPTVSYDALPLRDLLLSMGVMDGLGLSLGSMPSYVPPAEVAPAAGPAGSRATEMRVRDGLPCQ